MGRDVFRAFEISKLPQIFLFYDTWQLTSFSELKLRNLKIKIKENIKNHLFPGLLIHEIFWSCGQGKAIHQNGCKFEKLARKSKIGRKSRFFAGEMRREHVNFGMLRIFDDGAHLYFLPNRMVPSGFRLPNLIVPRGTTSKFHSFRKSLGEKLKPQKFPKVKIKLRKKQFRILKRLSTWTGSNPVALAESHRAEGCCSVLSGSAHVT